MSIYEKTHDVGGMTADYWDRDPKRMGFVLARYKFVARMFEGLASVLEIGCADGWGARVVRQHVGRLDAIDIEAKSIEEAKAQQSSKWPVNFEVGNIMDGPRWGPYDAAYCLDVLEHIPKEEEGIFLRHMATSAPKAIIGMPSLESQAFASELSRLGHVNCKTGAHLRATLKLHYEHVFIFSMNDEVVHTGFHPMAHYLIGLCVR